MSSKNCMHIGASVNRLIFISIQTYCIVILKWYMWIACEVVGVGGRCDITRSISVLTRPADVLIAAAML